MANATTNPPGRKRRVVIIRGGLNTVGAWQHRPVAKTGIRNLFMAGDYCRTDADLTTMESAVLSGLNAAQAILARDGKTPDVGPLPLESPPRAARPGEVSRASAHRADRALEAPAESIAPLAREHGALTAAGADQPRGRPRTRCAMMFRCTSDVPA